MKRTEEMDFRLTNLQAAVGLGQLERIDERVAVSVGWGRNYLSGHFIHDFTACSLLYSTWYVVLCGWYLILGDHVASQQHS